MGKITGAGQSVTAAVAAIVGTIDLKGNPNIRGLSVESRHNQCQRDGAQDTFLQVKKKRAFDQFGARALAM